ncbi:hypothetical protein N7495_009778 [Penicillium taxi]|uniref:uncharacterized protein n=1 Tax=Penicillium taxi TaxID=168475 RepID=UPI002545A3F8|nr:uncharacterized protein N7495_009778 [Penicillium taxi]KAJ5885268.1 hypothetical protein N7495_009778 [Penicillium taxi]
MATPEQIVAQIQNSKGLTASPAWINSFLASSTAQRNTPALIQTAIFRILASDFRESLSTTPTSRFPVDVYDTNLQERCLQVSIPVQVLDIEDIGSSLWSQVEAIERIERGEAIRGREIIRTITVGEDADAAAHNAPVSTGSGPHRLILQDACGVKAVAIEMERVEGLSLDKLSIGSKIMLKNVTVARGIILLNPSCVTVLGGKIDALDRPWKEERKRKLLENIAALEADIP